MTWLSLGCIPRTAATALRSLGGLAALKLCSFASHPTRDERMQTLAMGSKARIELRSNYRRLNPLTHRRVMKGIWNLKERLFICQCQAFKIRTKRRRRRKRTSVRLIFACESCGELWKLFLVFNSRNIAHDTFTWSTVQIKCFNIFFNFLSNFSGLKGILRTSKWWSPTCPCCMLFWDSTEKQPLHYPKPLKTTECLGKFLATIVPALTFYNINQNKKKMCALWDQITELLDIWPGQELSLPSAFTIYI